ncbi:MAG: glycosyltransferase [Chloroflexi bacterium]|nr:glycosyltransferase [Chloroflexota bacterium]
MSEVKFISIIIPTYNRLGHLMRALDHLERQTASMDSFEVIVVDGGSEDGTTPAIKDRMEKSPFVLKSCRQGMKGPGSNRNLGLRHATGEVVLFLNDDVFATPQLVEAHQTFHRAHPAAWIGGLGHVDQAAEVQTTPFMRWFVPFPFWLVRQPRLDYTFFWTCNLSLKRAFMLEKGTFTEAVAYGAHEDIELGYRLERQGFELYYLPDALGYHHHPTNFAAECKRQYHMGYYLPVLITHVPDPHIYYWYPIPNPKLPPFTGAWFRSRSRDVVRRALLNDLTVPRILRPVIESLETHDTLAPLARPLYWKAMSYYFRKGFAVGQREFKPAASAAMAERGSLGRSSG